ncbi:MAG: hypothetical protein HY902_17660 [Deltaproteobacteria bacterium]|nr:hypothetical protein [Deltaproteobacteria bacterium]
MTAVRLVAWCCAALLLPRLAVAIEDPADPSARPPLRTAGPVEPAPPKDLLYDGNYTSFLVGALLPRLDRALPGLDNQGLGLALAGRFSVITQFSDVALLLQHAQWSGASASLQRTELGATMSVHPAFPLIVFNSWWYDVISGIHGYVGASLARIALDGSAAVAATGQTGDSSSDWRPSLSAGVGADIPISPRDRHSGWWLTARYELRWTRFGAATPDWNLGDAQALILIGYRSYDNGYLRLPRPF